MMEIVVATDGTRRSLRALPHAWLLAQAVDAEIRLVQIVEGQDASGEPGTLPGEAIEDALNRAQARLEEALREYNVTGSTAAVAPYSLEAVPEALLRAAHRSDAKLIAVSTRGTGIQRMIFGSLAQRLLQFSDLPVMVAGPRVEGQVAHGQTYRLVITDDGSETTISALKALEPVLEATRCEVVLLRVYAPTFGDRGEAVETEAAEQHLQELQSQLPERLHVEAVIRTTRGLQSVDEAIVEAAGELAANVIVMLTRSHEARRRVLLGSTAMATLARSSVPLVLVPIQSR